jgi:hypothetical protein
VKRLSSRLTAGMIRESKVSSLLGFEVLREFAVTYNHMHEIDGKTGLVGGERRGNRGVQH